MRIRFRNFFTLYDDLVEFFRDVLLCNAPSACFKCILCFKKKSKDLQTYNGPNNETPYTLQSLFGK